MAVVAELIRDDRSRHAKRPQRFEYFHRYFRRFELRVGVYLGQRHRLDSDDDLTDGSLLFDQLVRCLHGLGRQSFQSGSQERPHTAFADKRRQPLKQLPLAFRSAVIDNAAEHHLHMQ